RSQPKRSVTREAMMSDHPPLGQFLAKCRRLRVAVLAAMLVVIPAIAGGIVERSESQSADVTIKGNVLGNRATEPKDWFWDPKDGDHTPFIYAFEGTKAIAESLGRIMEGYPDRGLNVEEALRIQQQFDNQLKYFLVPGPMTEKIHKNVEAGSRLLAVTGR